jgi:hypothetical protein
MRTRIKLFYHAPWQTGAELLDEYREWLWKYENPASSLSFSWVAEQQKGNWRRVWYIADE